MEKYHIEDDHIAQSPALLPHPRPHRSTSSTPLASVLTSSAPPKRPSRESVNGKLNTKIHANDENIEGQPVSPTSHHHHSYQNLASPASPAVERNHLSTPIRLPHKSNKIHPSPTTIESTPTSSTSHMTVAATPVAVEASSDVKVRVHPPSPSSSSPSPRNLSGVKKSVPKNDQSFHPPPLLRRTSTLLTSPTLLKSTDIGDHHHPVDQPPPNGFFKPNTRGQIAWSYLIMVISIYCSVTIPYRMAFWNSPIEVDGYLITMLILDSLGDLCFFAEIYRALHTGYIENGTVVYDSTAIWKRYAQSWFVLDVITCVPLDFIQLAYMEVIPTVRVVKILRLFQVLHHYNVIEENTTVSLQFRIGKLLFYTGILSHFASCIKYHVILSDHAGNTIHDHVLSKPSFGRYLQSFYWATGAMTGRDDTNPPENLADAGFTVVMMVVGILWLAYIIASLETFAHDENNSSARFQTKVAYVQQFMYQFNLPEEIHDKVRAYFSYLWTSSLRYDTAHFLNTLPKSLQIDVHLSMNRIIARADLFVGVDAGFLAELVQRLTTIVTIPNEVICEAHHIGDEMYFIEQGEIEICIGPKLAPIAKLREGDHFGEYAIFSSTHQRTSTARSVGYSTLLQLKADDLHKALVLFPMSNQVVRRNVEEHRMKTLRQERNFLGLSMNKNNKNGDHRVNDKLKKLIAVDHTANMSSSSLHSRWTLSPSSKLYQRWQLVYFLVMTWNGLIIPLRIGFLEHTFHPWMMTIDYIGDVFLICDILLNFRLRFVQGGSEIRDLTAIRYRYMSGWFIPHCFASIPLDFGMITGGMQPLYRLNRIIRLAHVHKTILGKLKDAAHYNLLSLLYLISSFLFLSHWAASVYYSFSTFEGFQSDLPNGHPNYEGWRPASVLSHGQFIYKYLQSQYYAMALLAGIGRHLYPPSDVDVILSLIVMLTGVFVVSYLIGTVGRLIFNLNASAAEFKNEITNVSQVLEERKVTPDIAQRVITYMRHIWTSQKGIDPNVAIHGLPKQLRTDIMMHLFEELLRKVPKFKELNNDFIRQLASELTFVELPQGEYVFRQGQIGESMYFISNGLVEIVFDAMANNGSEGGNESSKKSSTTSNDGSPSSSPSSLSSSPSSHQLKVIGSGSFFGEGALFAGTRSASIRTLTPVRLLALSGEAFQRVMYIHPIFGEKIMFLNQERQKKMEQKLVGTIPGLEMMEISYYQQEDQPSHRHHAPTDADPSHPSYSPRHHRQLTPFPPRQSHRPSNLSPSHPTYPPSHVASPAAPTTIPPRKSAIGVRRSVIGPVGQSTDLAQKVEKLIQQLEKTKECTSDDEGEHRDEDDLQTNNIAQSIPSSAPVSSKPNNTHANIMIESAVSTSSSPLVPSSTSFESHHRLAVAPTGAVPASRTIPPSHSAHSTVDHGTYVNANVSPIHRPVTVPSLTSSENERSLHAGVPPGYNMSESEHDLRDSSTKASETNSIDTKLTIASPSNPTHPIKPSHHRLNHTGDVFHTLPSPTDPSSSSSSYLPSANSSSHPHPVDGVGRNSATRRRTTHSQFNLTHQQQIETNTITPSISSSSSSSSSALSVPTPESPLSTIKMASMSNINLLKPHSSNHTLI